MLIPGTKRIEYLEENLGSPEVQLLAAGLAQIDEIAPQRAIAELRYPEVMM